MVTQWPVFVELSAHVYLYNCKAFWHIFEYWLKFLIRTLFAIRRDIYCANSCVYLQKYSSYPLQTWNSYSVSQGECIEARMVTQWPVFVELSALVYLDNCKAFWHSFVYFKKYSSYPLQTWNSYSVSQGECIEARMVTQWPVFVELSALVYLDNCKAFWHSFCLACDEKSRKRDIGITFWCPRPRRRPRRPQL